MEKSKGLPAGYKNARILIELANINQIPRSEARKRK